MKKSQSVRIAVINGVFDTYGGEHNAHRRFFFNRSQFAFLYNSTFIVGNNSKAFICAASAFTIGQYTFLLVNTTIFPIPFLKQIKGIIEPIVKTKQSSIIMCTI